MSNHSPAAWRRLLLPASLLQAGWLSIFALTATRWLALTPSPLTASWNHWRAPGGWDPTRGPVGIVAPDVAWSLLLLALLLVGIGGVSFWAVARSQTSHESDRRSLGFVVLAAAIMGLTLVALPVLPSDDIFSYALYGRIGVIYHQNPLLATPGQFTGDPFLAHVFWQATRSVYGPAWLLVSDVITLLAQGLGGSVAAYIALYKLLGLGCHLANCALIWAILTKLAPRRRLMGTLLYAWNPLALWEFAAAAHNDALMLTLFLLGIWLLTRRQTVLALLAWGASIAVKYVFIVLLPLWLWQVARQIAPREGETTRDLWLRRGKAVSWRGSVVLGAALALALPFWAGPATLGALIFSPPAQRLDNSLLDALSWPLSAITQALGASHSAARAGTITLLKVIGLLAFLGGWLAQLLRRAPRDILGAWTWALLGYLFLASGWFWPWYATWPLALVALRPFDRLTRAVVLLATGALTLYSFLPVTASPLYGYRAFLVFGPALAYLAWSWRRARLARQAAVRLSDSSVTGVIPARLGR